MHRQALASSFFGGAADSRFVGGVDHGEMSIKIFTALDYQIR